MRQSFIPTFGENPPGRCDSCGGAVVVAICGEWETHPEKAAQQEFVEPRGETSCNYCSSCNRLTAIFHHNLE